MHRHILSAASLLALASFGLAQVVHTPSYPFTGDAPGDTLGIAVSGAGDVDADGFDDFVLGAYFADINGFNSGSARVISGRTGATLYTFHGDSGGDRFGTAVSGVGDLNNDGHADLFVGAPGDDDGGSETGSARVFSGADGSILFTLYADGYLGMFGWRLSCVGDVNNDGVNDLVVGSQVQSEGTPPFACARVYSGVDGAPIMTLYHDSPFAVGGYVVSGAGDVNNDGIDDIIVGTPKDNDLGIDSGSIRVFSGADGSILRSISGKSPGDEFGSSVSGVGDINNDGHADFIVGARLDDRGFLDSGSAWVFSGIDGSVLFVFDGESAGDHFGASVSSAGDVNGDGFTDFIVGAPLTDANGSNSGRAVLFSGADGARLAVFDGGTANARFGSSVSGAGDVNNDGFDDFLIGAPFEGSSAGAARVFLSVPLPAAPTPCPGDATGDQAVDFDDLNAILANFGLPCSK